MRCTRLVIYVQSKSKPCFRNRRRFCDTKPRSLPCIFPLRSKYISRQDPGQSTLALPCGQRVANPTWSSLRKALIPCQQLSDYMTFLQCSRVAGNSVPRHHQFSCGSDPAQNMKPDAWEGIGLSNLHNRYPRITFTGFCCSNISARCPDFKR